MDKTVKLRNRRENFADAAYPRKCSGGGFGEARGGHFLHKLFANLKVVIYEEDGYVMNMVLWYI